MIHAEARKYIPEIVSADEIYPSPENDDIYGKIRHDEQMEALIKSIGEIGIEEPIIISAVDYITSGHRRYYACVQLRLHKSRFRAKRSRARETSIVGRRCWLNTIRSE